MKNNLFGNLLLAGAVTLAVSAQAQTKPLKALLLTGGCCHDYKNQKEIISKGISARANVEWTIVLEEGGTTHKDIANSTYNKPDWAKGYDIIVHNECFASDTDPAYIEKALAPHRDGVPGIILHCQMHTFRDYKEDKYREFLGVTSKRHGPQHPLDVKVVKADHPIMAGFPADWKTGNEELYAIEKVWPNTITLATANDKVKEKAPPGQKAPDKWNTTEKSHTLIWVNTYGKTRVFGTTLAHANKTMEDPVFLDLMTRGLLWACDKLDDNGKPKPGYEAKK
ncbi:MAG: ThuA domain-containing protein [Verrucomicrobiota bacterium]